MSSQPKSRLTSQEYLALEREAAYKSEYYKGEVFAFAGASLRHNLISVNILANIHNQLRGGPGSAFPSDMRITIPQTPHYTYADIVVVYGQPELDDDFKDNLLNPIVIVEVLSPSTESYDRGKKFESYQRIASLMEYVLVSQDRPRVEQFLRQTDGRWQQTKQAWAHVAFGATFGSENRKALSFNFRLPNKDLSPKLT